MTRRPFLLPSWLLAFTALFWLYSEPLLASEQSCLDSIRAFHTRLFDFDTDRTATPRELEALRQDPRFGPELRRIEAELDRGRLFGPLAQLLRRRIARECGIEIDLDALYARVLRSAIADAYGSSLSHRGPDNVGPLRFADHRLALARNETHLRRLIVEHAKNLVFEAKQAANAGNYPEGWLTPGLRRILQEQGRKIAEERLAFIRERWAAIFPLSSIEFRTRPFHQADVLSPDYFVSEGRIAGPPAARIVLTHSNVEVVLQLTPAQMAALAENLRQNPPPENWLGHRTLRGTELRLVEGDLVHHLQFPLGRFPVARRGAHPSENTYEVTLNAIVDRDGQTARLLSRLFAAAAAPPSNPPPTLIGPRDSVN